MGTEWIEDLPEPLRGLAIGYGAQSPDNELVFSAEVRGTPVRTTAGEFAKAAETVAKELAKAKADLARWTGSFEDYVLVPAATWREAVEVVNMLAIAAGSVENRYRGGKEDDAVLWTGENAGLTLGDLRRARTTFLEIDDEEK
jgi:hypothetical protein